MLILFAGLRDGVGVDYYSYRNIYTVVPNIFDFFYNVDYLDSNFKEQSKDYLKQQSDKESEEKYGF